MLSPHPVYWRPIPPTDLTDRFPGVAFIWEQHNTLYTFNFRVYNYTEAELQRAVNIWSPVIEDKIGSKTEFIKWVEGEAIFVDVHSPRYFSDIEWVEQPGTGIWWPLEYSGPCL